ncbi:MAG: 2-phosphosulfolactate phosphatase [bacterium]
MKIQVFFTHDGVSESLVKGKLIAVIDVLRMSTTIVYAHANGCERILPVESVEAASKLAASLDKAVTLLGGEKEGKRIDGFDLGNSPLEYTREVVEGKNLILSTTNGTRAITKTREADEVVVGCFANMRPVLEHIARAGDKPIGLLCAGKQGRFALEDAVCAGMMIDLLANDGEVELDDAGVAARLLYLEHKASVPELVRNCEHGKYLAGIGFEKDLEVCAAVDSLNTLPVVSEGRIDRQKARRKRASKKRVA